ncbi:MAG: hypothetical protein PHC52_13265 [Syntrophales bacterium]|nr:hypothetical protein [Syntrophales bacterium]
MAPEVNALTKSTGGVFNSVEKLSEAVKALGERFNLVQPGGAVGGDLPLLHAAGISFVFVDAQNETYRIPGRSQVGIGKNALDRIAAAAGVRWNPHLCGLVGNSSDPNLVEYQAVGTVLQLDGTERMITAVKRIDLRADKSLPVEKWGSDAQEIARVAAKADPPREPWPQILQQRQHILSLAESKAKNRAIRSLGVRTAYEPGELSKGFAIMRLQFTGRSDDPEVEREVSMMIARRALGASAMLYGPPSESHAALPPSRPSATVPRVTTIDSEPAAEEEHEPDPGAKETPAADEPAGGAAPAAKEPAEDPLVICGKKNADGSWPKKPCSALTVTELKAKIAAYEKKRPEWDPKWAKKNEAELNSIKSWLAYREMDPRQAELNMDQAAAAESDEVPY